jgi:hypothetical protein
LATICSSVSGSNPVYFGSPSILKPQMLRTFTPFHSFGLRSYQDWVRWSHAVCGTRELESISASAIGDYLGIYLVIRRIFILGGLLLFPWTLVAIVLFVWAWAPHFIVTSFGPQFSNVNKKQWNKIQNEDLHKQKRIKQEWYRWRKT